MTNQQTNQIDTYLSLIYPSKSSYIALCLIPPDGEKPEHRFAPAEKVPKLLSYARYRNAHGWGIYITPSVMKPHPQNRRKESFLNVQEVIYLDCDRRECLDTIKENYPYPTLVVKTSKGRYQVYWRLDKPTSIAEQETLMQIMAIKIGADRAATDVSRVLRLPSFWNRKPNREPNTVDIVFTRDHVVTYKSLSLRVTKPILNEQSYTQKTSTHTQAGRVLANSMSDRTQSTGDITESERDWYEVHRRLALGSTPVDLVNWLERRRQDKRNPRYYAKLTVRRAIESRKREGQSRQG